MECAICCEEFNRRGRKPVTCIGCEFSACQGCVQRYLLDENNITDPHCMSCKRPWLYEFLTDNLPKTSFIDGAFKKRREEVLFERERSFLPATQLLIERDIKNEKITAAIAERYKLINQLKEEIRQLRMGDEEDTKSSRGESAFVRACPADECRGFLNNRWECGICNVKVCKECHDIIGKGEHKCDANAQATARLLARDSKPCPNCAALIFKIDGCDQMYCTQCHVAFSWRTGEIVRNGRIHNPHYYEYMRQQNNGVIPREPEDIDPGLCNELPTAWSLQNVINRLGIKDKPEIIQIWKYHRYLIHVEHVELQRFPQSRPVDINANMDIRKQYMRGLISEDTFKVKLQQREKKRGKCNEINQVLSMFLQVGTERILSLYTNMMRLKNDKTLSDEVTECNKAFAQLRLYVNESLGAIGKRYNNHVPMIDESWNTYKTT